MVFLPSGHVGCGSPQRGPQRHAWASRIARGLAIGLLALGILSPRSRAASWALSGNLGAHDPSIIKEGGTWWVFSTGAGLQVKHSADGLNWVQGVPIFASELPWWRTYAPTMGLNDVWAPDVRFFAGRFWCYYCVSEFGTNNSAIGLTSCSSIALGDWRDDGVVLSSESGAQSYNALDPDLSVDASGNPWLVFGSFFDGIHVMKLDPATMKPTGPMYSIAARPNGIEAANIVYNGGYYTLFVSIDKCCLGVNSTYKIAFGRSTSITGPYSDESNVAMLASGGTVLDSSGPRWIGPGGESVYNDGNGWIIVFHAYDALNNGDPTLMISDLYWDSNGWPTFTSPPPVPAPVFTTQPVSVTVTGGTVALDAVASNAATYRWTLNGTSVAGAADSVILIGDASAATGSYACVATNASGSATSNTATVGVDPGTAPARLVNISARTQVGTGAGILFGGFAIGGSGTSGTQPLLIRASGPAIAAAPFDVPGTLPDPQLQLFDSAQAVIAGNFGWGGSAAVTAAQSLLGAFAWQNPASDDSALSLSLSAGAYTAQVAGKSGDTGDALVEIYDATPAANISASAPHLVNLSARAFIGTGPNALIAGFVIQGSSAMTVLVRASGPALQAFGIAGTLPDPQLTLEFQSNGAPIASNSSWGGAGEIAATAAQVGAFTWASAASHDSALLVTLPPGQYTAVVSGETGDTGIGIVEIYEVP